MALHVQLMCRWSWNQILVVEFCIAWNCKYVGGGVVVVATVVALVTVIIVVVVNYLHSCHITLNWPKIFHVAYLGMFTI